MKTKIATLIAACALTAVSAFAQISFSPVAGLNFANLVFSSPSAGLTLTTSSIVNFNVGGKVAYGFNEMIAVESGLLITGTGAKLSESANSYSVSIAATIYNLQIPINAVFAFNAGPGKFLAFGGPYFNIALSGGSSLTSNIPGENSSTTTYKFGNDANNDNFRTLDIGLNFGIGYEIKHVQIRLQEGLGLRNLAPQANSTGSIGSINNRVFQISFAYVFGGKK